VVGVVVVVLLLLLLLGAWSATVATC